MQHERSEDPVVVAQLGGERGKRGIDELDIRVEQDRDWLMDLGNAGVGRAAEPDVLAQFNHVGTVRACGERTLVRRARIDHDDARAGQVQSRRRQQARNESLRIVRDRYEGDSLSARYRGTHAREVLRQLPVASAEVLPVVQAHGPPAARLAQFRGVRYHLDDRPRSRRDVTWRV
jgi:hypothetical protein